MSDNGLTVKQMRFVGEYLIDLNATKAAVRAKYSEKTANKVGPRLLVDIGIQEAIQKAMAERSKRTQISQDRVIQELAAIAFSDIRDYLDYGPGDVKLKELSKLPEEMSRAIAEVSHSGGQVKFKLYDKQAALDKLGRHLGMFDERVRLLDKGGESLSFNINFVAPDHTQTIDIEPSPKQLKAIDSVKEEKSETEGGTPKD